MDNLETVISFTYPHEAHLAKGKLESEGVEVFMKDELTVQVHNFYSNAIGGVKLQVRGSDFETAHRVLVASGYIQEQKDKSNKLLSKLDKWTAKLPLIGNAAIELRLIIPIAILVSILIVSIR